MERYSARLGSCERHLCKIRAHRGTKAIPTKTNPTSLPILCSESEELVIEREIVLSSVKNQQAIVVRRKKHFQKTVPTFLPFGGRPVYGYSLESVRLPCAAIRFLLAVASARWCLSGTAAAAAARLECF